MEKKLFLLDGLPLVYRSHFALMNRPIFTSYGFNTSGLFGFTQTLLEILRTQQPTHIGVVFDTEKPTERHQAFPDYKLQREAMPEDLGRSLPHVCRMIEAFNITMVSCDGFEADDVIGTLVRKAEEQGFVSYMVTLDKDFGQLVSPRIFLYKLARMGDAVEIMGPPEILKKWGIERVDQIPDILGLWGDTIDNIPGVPGIGEKTASKLISQYGSVENLLENTADLKGKLRENLQTHREVALLSKRLATIRRDAPCDLDLESLKLKPRNDEELKKLFIEFEFNSIGRRLYGDSFKSRTASAEQPDSSQSAANPTETMPGLDFESAERPVSEEPRQFALETQTSAEQPPAPSPVVPNLKAIDQVPHQYHLVETTEGRLTLWQTLQKGPAFAFFVVATGFDPKTARILGIGFSRAAHEAFYLPLPDSPEACQPILSEAAPLFEDAGIEKIGHDLKWHLSVMKWAGINVRGRLFDVMLAHSLIEPDRRHAIDQLSEIFLGYSSMPVGKLLQEISLGRLNLNAIQPSQLADFAAETADLIGQLKSHLQPLLADKHQERVFYQVESPLIQVLADMEFEGVRLDAAALAEFGEQLKREMAEKEKLIHRLAGTEFNLNSAKQLGEVLFDVLKLADKPKKTRTGQYATDEQTLLSLASDHQIVARLLEYRTASKLKSTYADSLPTAVCARTGRVHTIYHQAATSTGRLSSQDPNLQNIPIRTEQGREIRKAFVPREGDYQLLSADYSQIELRIIAVLSQEKAMLEAFSRDIDIHTATAARVYGVPLDDVTSEMRRKAKMVNYGIAYGISAFGLAQRLGIPRKEGAAIIDQYFIQFPRVREYMLRTIAFCRQHGFVETITGRRRYIREINSSNGTVRAAAERNAINAPIQGTAADMIKIAMKDIHETLVAKALKTRMLLQVHDELVFDLFNPEESTIRPLIREKMSQAIPLDVPIVVEIGVGRNWLEAH